MAMAVSLGISRCIESLGKLEHSVNERNDICELKNFLQILDTTLNCIQMDLQRAEFKTLRTKILLYLSHIQKLLPMFVSTVQEMEPYNKKVILYLYMGLKECLAELEKVFKGTAIDEDNVGKFVCGVECALKIISNHGDSGLPEEWKPCLDDLLCQAFTIAKIALNNDLNEIIAISQKILISSEAHMDPGMKIKHGIACQLFKDTITADLITLEHRVNTAVLRLVLKVFSDPDRPLKKLLLACDKPGYDRNFIESLYRELDNHVDCVLHICDFAVACCDNSKCLQKIQCCVATLEFLDSFLIPEISMFAKDMKNKEVRTLLKFLCKLWHSEVKNLEYLLDGVVDSTCFSEVTYMEVSERVIAIKKAAMQKSDFDVDMLEDAIKFCAKLSRHMNHTICLPNNGLVRDLSLVVNECEAVMNLYVKSRGNEVDHHSVAKRYELLAACVKRISVELADADDSDMDATINKTGFNAFTSRVKFPDSVRNLPLDVSADTSDFNGSGPDWLKRKYLSHVQKIKYEKNSQKQSDGTFVSPKTDLLKTYMSRVSERKSFLYKRTPRKTDTDDVKEEHSENKWQMNSSHLSLTVAEQDCSLEITDVLENLSSLPDTLTSLRLYDSSNVTVISNRALTNKIDQENGSDSHSTDNSKTDGNYESGSSVSRLSENRNLLSLVSVRTDEVSDVITPDRLNDIDAIDNKIKHLKMTIYGETQI